MKRYILSIIFLISSYSFSLSYNFLSTPTMKEIYPKSSTKINPIIVELENQMRQVAILNRSQRTLQGISLGPIHNRFRSIGSFQGHRHSRLIQSALYKHLTTSSSGL